MSGWRRPRPREGTGRAAWNATFVAKRLDGDQQREAAVYAQLLESLAPGAAPLLLGVERVDETTAYLYLEYVPAARVWPWGDLDRSAMVLEHLAALHVALPVEVYASSEVVWDYEAELQASAITTVALFDRVVAHESLAALRPAGRWLHRMVSALPAVRRRLLACRRGVRRAAPPRRRRGGFRCARRCRRGAGRAGGCPIDREPSRPAGTKSSPVRGSSRPLVSSSMLVACV